MSPAPPGPALASSEHVLTAPLPASGFRSQDPPLLPARAALTRAWLVVVAREEEDNERRAPDEKAKYSQRGYRRSGTREHRFGQGAVPSIKSGIGKGSRRGRT